jgi:uncharacterized protein YbcV (DUF1398 family)
MDIEIKRVMQEASRVSDEGGRSFPEIIGSLMAAGVERYHQDLRRSERTYYLPDGTSEVVGNDAVPVAPPVIFSAGGVEAAVRAAQAGAINYKEFCRRAMEAGCVGYVVSIVGKRVVYYGRTGDTHVEYFPASR